MKYYAEDIGHGHCTVPAFTKPSLYCPVDYREGHDTAISANYEHDMRYEGSYVRLGGRFPILVRAECVRCPWLLA